MALDSNPVSVSNAPVIDPKSGKLGTQVSTTEIADEMVDSGSPFLVVSPYTEQDHLLDLRTLDMENVLLAKALTKMDNVRPDYATAPYEVTFNWDEVEGELGRLTREAGHAWKETSFYIVVFRSRIPPTTSTEHLGALDKVAHAEATAAGGFLKYWFGKPDTHGRNLATCVWRSREDAKRGNAGPGHLKAVRATGGLYKEWAIERLRLTITDGVRNVVWKKWVD